MSDKADVEAAANPETTPLENANANFTLWKRILIYLFIPLLAMSVVLNFANMFIHDRLKICTLCPSNPSVANWFIYLSVWCLWTGTITFVMWTVACYRPNNRVIQEWTRRCFHVSLPWTTVVTIAYSIYLVQGGVDYDEDACYTVWQAAFPRDTSPQAAYTYIGFNIVTNITIHFLLFIVHVLLYASKSILYNQIWPFGLLFFILNGVVVGLVQKSGVGVYCTDHIWQDLGLQWIVFAILHAVFFYGYKKTCMRGGSHGDGGENE